MMSPGENEQPLGAEVGGFLPAFLLNHQGHQALEDREGLEVSVGGAHLGREGEAVGREEGIVLHDEGSMGGGEGVNAGSGGSPSGMEEVGEGGEEEKDHAFTNKSWAVVEGREDGGGGELLVEEVLEERLILVLERDIVEAKIGLIAEPT